MEAKLRINRHEGVMNLKEIHRGNDDWETTLEQNDLVAVLVPDIITTKLGQSVNMRAQNPVFCRQENKLRKCYQRGELHDDYRFPFAVKTLET